MEAGKALAAVVEHAEDDVAAAVTLNDCERKITTALRNAKTNMSGQVIVDVPATAATCLAIGDALATCRTGGLESGLRIWISRIEKACHER